MAMPLNIIIALSSLLTVNALFLPDCLWDSDSWDIPEENSQSPRYRRFLWDDSDVCDWMCDPDLLPHEVCNACCRRLVTPKPLPGKTQPGGSSNQNTNAQPAASSQPAPNAALNVVQQSNPQPNSQVPVGQGWQSSQPNQNWPRPPNQVWQQQPQLQPLDQNWQQSPQLQNQNWQQSPQPQNQNWQQSPQPQNQNWQQSPQPQNQNWQQSPQPQNQNWQLSPQPQNQNWQQQFPQNQNWQQLPQPQNQNWQHLPQVPNQNWNSQAQPPISGIQVPVAAPLNNEPLQVQVPINLTGLFQAQVPARLTTIFQNQPGAPAQGQLPVRDVTPTEVRPNQPQPPNDVPGSQNVGISQPQNQPNGMLPTPPRLEPPFAGSQQPQQVGASQQFLTAGQEDIQPDPQTQSPPAAQPVVNSVPGNPDDDGPNNDDGGNAT